MAFPTNEPPPQYQAPAPRHNHHDNMAANLDVAYPVQLHHIKALLLHKQYRQCIRACRDVLTASKRGQHISPLVDSFTSFYLGLAHDELARMMHPTSRAKVPSFDQAEGFYRASLAALPSVEDVLKSSESCAAKVGLDPFGSLLNPPSFDHSPIHERTTDVDDTAISFTHSPSPSEDIRQRAASPQSPGTPVSTSLSRPRSESDSHGSLAEILTPTRILPRDVSRMSLIATPTKRANSPGPMRPLPRAVASMSLLQEKDALQLPHAASYSLLKPVRLGSPARPYAQFQMPGSQHFKFPRPKSDRVSRSPKTGTACATIEEDDGFSANGSDSLTSGPSAASSAASPATSQCGRAASYGNARYDRATQISEHFDAIRIQLHAHLRMLDKARQEVIQERAKANLSPPRPTDYARAGSNGSYSPSNIPSPLPSGSPTRVTIATVQSRAEAKRMRMAAGRERKWVRERFCSERYQELAEKALAEL